MKFLGNISHITNSGRLIAKSSKSPSTGVTVYNKDKKKIGKVLSVFGPTKNPYISISVFKSIDLNDFEKSYGNDLYASVDYKKKKRGRGKRKKK